ncbi:hypothetical protein EJ04DRAFT_575624 [Polyplosphaeria fusca]|uniref:Uncharacterized protein n=1 Tax=Polyplosphaeria fusca TaxID=682080 RepID=A0A9P4R127_9PLEO|nr:hypothetical protein EJ04DRAFT_575624 [Polyplosphaeria fusca]
MGNLCSRQLNNGSAITVDRVSRGESDPARPHPVTVQGSEEFRCVNPAQPKPNKAAQKILNSQSADNSRAGFLDLPAELRNVVYRDLFVFPGYVRLLYLSPTKVSALALLRTCKQVHHEAASVLYGTNSFYCSLKKHAHIELDQEAGFHAISNLYFVAPQLELYYGETGAALQALAIDGIFFPAPRYHRFLTRLTIDCRVELRHSLTRVLDFADMVMRHGDEYHELFRVRDALNGAFQEVFKKMGELWGEKDTEWEGRLICLQKDWKLIESNYTITFAVAEDAERTSKAAWRKYCIE